MALNLYKLPNLTKIGRNSFQNCSSIDSINGAGLTKLSVIDHYAFAGTKGTISIDFGDSPVTTIAEGTFKECKATNWRLNVNAIKVIRSEAFSNSGNENTIPIEFICPNFEGFNNWAAFRYSYVVKSFIVPNTKIGALWQQEFLYAYNLEEVDFSNCTSLTKTVSNAGDWGLFQNCTKLKKVDFSNCTNLGNICRLAFGGCSALQEARFDNVPGITNIGIQAFSGTRSLNKLVLDVSNVEVIDASAFNGCGNISSEPIDFIINDNTLTTLGGSAFLDSHIIKSFVAKNSSITKIPSNTFTRAIRLTDVDLSGCADLTTIEGSAFNRAISLKNVNLLGASNLKELGQRIWECCVNMTDFKIEFSNTERTTLGTHTMAGWRDFSSLAPANYSNIKAIVDDDFKANVANVINVTFAGGNGELPERASQYIVNGVNMGSVVLNLPESWRDLVEADTTFTIADTSVTNESYWKHRAAWTLQGNNTLTVNYY